MKYAPQCINILQTFCSCKMPCQRLLPGCHPLPNLALPVHQTVVRTGRCSACLTALRIRIFLVRNGRLYIRALDVPGSIGIYSHQADQVLLTFWDWGSPLVGVRRNPALAPMQTASTASHSVLPGQRCTIHCHRVNLVPGF